MRPSPPWSRTSSSATGPDDRPIYRPCIDPVTRPHRVLLYELFTQKCWTSYRISRHFNALKVEGWDGWTDAGVKKVLRSPSAIGVFIWNRTRREYDWDQGRWVVVNNPRFQWEVYYDPELAIVPLAWWTAARKRLSAMRRKCPLTGRKPSRNQRSATTLFNLEGTLFCGGCGRELVLNRSAGRNRLLYCPNGRTRTHGCQLTTAKSTRIIERCLLGFLVDGLLTGEAIQELVTEANIYLAEEARKRRVDTAPLKASIRNKEAAIKRLFGRIDGQEDEALVQAYEKRISELQKEVNRSKAELGAAESADVAPRAPWTRRR